MKAAILFTLLLIPCLCLGQTKKDYMAAMDKYVKLYNGRDVDKMCASLFASDTDTCFWKWAHIDNDFDEYGKITAYEYLGITAKDPEHVTVFKVQYEKAGKKTMSFTLRENLMFGTFRFDTSSDEIAAMLRDKK